MMRSATDGPRSLMRTSTARPLPRFVTSTRVPSGRVRCAAVRAFMSRPRRSPSSCRDAPARTRRPCPSARRAAPPARSAPLRPPWPARGAAARTTPSRARAGLPPEPVAEAAPPFLHAVAEAAVLATGLGLGAGEKDFLARLRAEPVRGLAVREIDLDEGHARRHAEVARADAVERRPHELRPDRQGAFRATEAVHVVAVIADPHGRQEPGPAAHEPRVAAVVGRAGLDRKSTRLNSSHSS